ncbi:hypothetical protein GCM10010994_31360 [Chelatococcus reniformis]|uniref:Uncharacterized protein n=2 Tax=Chelatococcus reniformis TaxID=1494448 RepID=A0A916XFZ6_9HYPH|nr:hypothetical protein GCM10010994_31360 [Chelatococcus reniformis]
MLGSFLRGRPKAPIVPVDRVQPPAPPLTEFEAAVAQLWPHYDTVEMARILEAPESRVANALGLAREHQRRLAPKD